MAFYVFAGMGWDKTYIGKAETRDGARKIVLKAPKNQKFWVISKVRNPDPLRYDHWLFSMWYKDGGYWTEYKNHIHAVNKDGSPGKKKIIG